MKMEKLLENKISRRFKVRRLEINDFGYLMEHLYGRDGIAYEAVSYTHLDVYKRQLFHRDASVCICGGSSATEYETAHAYRLGAFQLVRERLDALPLQLHNHTAVSYTHLLMVHM